MAFSSGAIALYGVAIAGAGTVYGAHEANKQKQLEEDQQNKALPQPQFQGEATAAQLNAANQKAQAAGGTLLAPTPVGSNNSGGKTLLG